MTTLTVLALFCLAIGALLSVVGWVLNTRTPIQQPLPVFGFGIFVIGVVLLIIKVAML